MFLRAYIGILLLLATTPAFAAPVQVIERPDDDLVLVSLQIERVTLADSITGYANKSGLMLPLGQVAQALEFPIKVTPQEGQAEGWIYREDNHFALDAARREVVANGTRKQIGEGQVEAHSDDIYVDTALLAEWFGSDFEFSFSTQTVTLRPREGVKLPVQLQAERKLARQQIGRSDTRGAEGPFPRQEIPYRLATIPYTDLTYTGGYDKRSYAGVHNGLSAVADGDLLYMQSNVYASFEDSRKSRDFRMTLSRRDPDGKILQSDDTLTHTKFGEMVNQAQIREVSVGDISTQQLPLTAFNQQGRGVLVSTIPYDRATQYNRTTVQGDLLPGWEVELYRNDELLSFQRASANGRYEFIDVPLLSGINIIRLVFYGPSGQTREEVQRFLVSDQLTQQGKSYFRASASQQNTNTFDTLNQNQIVSLSGVTPQQTAAIKGKPRAMFEYEYGLLDNLSLFANSSYLTTPDNVERGYVGTGLATTFNGTYARADVARDVSNGGNALRLLLQDNIAGISLSGEHQHYFDFISEFTESANDSIVRRSTIRADRALALPYLPQLNNGISAAQTVYDSNREVNEFTYRLATSVNRLALSHNLNYRTDTSPAPETVTGIGGLPVTINFKSEQTTGDFLMSFPFRKFVLRGNLVYGISPDAELQTLITSAEYNFSHDTNVILQVDKQFISTPRITNYTVGINHNFEKFRLGTLIGHASDGENTLGVTLSLSFGPDPRTGKFKVYPDYSATSGLISARAFHDINGDGVFNEGDKPLENARFRVNRGSSQQATDEQGNVLLRNLQPDVRNSLTLDAGSLENPYLLSKTEGMDVVTRAGVPAMVDFAVTGSGDVEGTVRILTIEDEEKDAANVTVQMFNAEGKLVRETQTSYDGYYLFNGVPAGNYTLRVSAEQAARLGFITPPDRVVSISNDETDSKVLDLMIIRDPLAMPEPARQTEETAAE